MSSNKNMITVFSKPWPEKSIEELADFLADVGFDGVELPVRPNFQVTPETVSQELPRAARVFEQRGLKIQSVAGPENEETIAALGDAGVPILRVMAKIDMSKGYAKCTEEHRSRWRTLLPALEKHGVTIGVQNHADYYVGSAVGLVQILDGFDTKLVGAVLDPAHCGLDGEPDDMAIDIAWPVLVMVNLKSAFWKMKGGLESGDLEWEKHWTTGRYGITSWPRVVSELKERGYKGAYCLTAEYRGWEARADLTGDAVDPLIADDLAYAKSLING
jgi:sugar phosphate isomerase/epimerase